MIPDESKALSLLAPANAVAGLLPGGGLLPTPNPVPSVSVNHCNKRRSPSLDYNDVDVLSVVRLVVFLLEV